MKRILNDEFLKVKKKITVYVSPDILLEISKVLIYPKIDKILRKAKISQKEILRAIEVNSSIVRRKVNFNIVDDVEDNRILECAVAAKADIVVSGDKHLIELGQFKKIKILTPRELIDYLTQ